MPPFNVPEPLKILEKPEEIDAFTASARAAGKRIGFVPTMGALHEGHLSLISRALCECDVVICSIFVNPTQFNDPKDYERYPRVMDEDVKMLESVGCHAVFAPSEKIIYPDDSFKLQIEFGFLETVLEGKHRPGHFKGVGMVVKRLFEVVKPDRAFFGLKDYQQVMVIKELVRQFSIPVEIIGMPTIREADGLAMSSRNRLLSPEERTTALHLSRVLREAKAVFGKTSIADIKSNAIRELEALPNVKVDYFEISDGHTLQTIHVPSESSLPVALLAVFVGKVRLIDNMFLV